MELLNAISNFLVMFAASFFLIGIFGRNSKTIESMSFLERGFIKISLAIVASGSMLNLLSGEVPHATEIILNFGLGLLFVWASYFHFKFFVNRKKD